MLYANISDIHFQANYDSSSGFAHQPHTINSYLFL